MLPASSKGNDFIRECKRLGAAVVLLTREKLLDADWARESLDDLIAIPGKTSVRAVLPRRGDLRRAATACIARGRARRVRHSHSGSHPRTPGYFGHGHNRRALLSGQAGNAAQSQRSRHSPTEIVSQSTTMVDEFMKRTSSPWMLKPRIGASAMGMKKLHDPEAVWRAIANLDAREALHEIGFSSARTIYSGGRVSRRFVGCEARCFSRASNVTARHHSRLRTLAAYPSHTS